MKKFIESAKKYFSPVKNQNKSKKEEKSVAQEKILQGGEGVASAGTMLAAHVMDNSLDMKFIDLGLVTAALRALSNNRKGPASLKEAKGFRARSAILVNDAAKWGAGLGQHATHAIKVASVAGHALPGLNLLGKGLNLGLKLKEKDNKLAIANEIAKILLTGAGIALIPVTMGGSAILLGVAAGLDGLEIFCKVAVTVNNKLNPGKLSKESIELDEIPIDDSKIIQQIQEKIAEFLAQQKEFLDEETPDWRQARFDVSTHDSPVKLTDFGKQSFFKPSDPSIEQDELNDIDPSNEKDYLNALLQP